MTAEAGFRKAFDSGLVVFLEDNHSATDVFDGSMQIEANRGESGISIRIKKRNQRQSDARTLLEIPSDYCERFEKAQVPESR